MAITLTFPSGVTTPRAQVHPILVSIAGLTASTAFELQYRQPAGTITATGSIAPFTEISFTSDAAGTASFTWLPQVSGLHTVAVVPSGYVIRNTISPAMGASVIQRAATQSTTLTVGP